MSVTLFRLIVDVYDPATRELAKRVGMVVYAVE